jgi:hypothetical protein
MSLEEYKELVRTHPAQVKRLEETARMLAMFLPTSRLGRFSEVFTESTYSVLGLVGLFHDRILQSAGRSALTEPLLGGAQLQPRRQEPRQPQWVRLVRLVLTLLAHTEVVLEMLARVLGGEGRRLAVIALIESVKAFSRLVLLGQSKAGALLVAGGQFQTSKKAQTPPAEADLEAGGAGAGGEGSTSSGAASTTIEIQELDAEGQPAGAAEGSAGPAESADALAPTPAPAPAPAIWQGRRSGKQLSLPPSLSAFDNTGASATPKAAAALRKQAQQQQPSLQGLRMGPGPEDLVLRLAGEVLHIVRPVMYVAMVSRAGANKAKSSWRPLVVSLSLDLLAMRCSAAACPPGAEAQQQQLPPAEVLARAARKLLVGGAQPAAQQGDRDADELKRRRGLVALYLMRSPVYELITLPAVQRVAKGLGHLPAVGASIEPLITETVGYYHRVHFYTSAST